MYEIGAMRIALSIKSVGSSPDGPADAFRRSLDNIRGLVASLTS